MSCDFRMPGCFTRCGDTLWEKSEQPWRPEASTERRPCSIRSLDFFGADVFQEMWDRKRLENRKEIETDARFVMLCCFLYGHGALTANEQNNLTIVSIEWNAHTAHCLLLHRVEVHYLDGLSATLFGMACSDKVSVPACMRRAAFTSEKSQSHIYEPLIAVSTAKSCNNCQLNVKHLIFA